MQYVSPGKLVLSPPPGGGDGGSRFMVLVPFQASGVHCLSSLQSLVFAVCTTLNL